MIPRGKLYISYKELLVGMYYCFTNRKKRPIKSGFSDNKFICLSVRTGFDLALRALNFPAGSEILVTGINIPDMFRIVTAHGLKPIPLSVNKRTLGISAAQAEASITPTTKAILITHLFGAIMETDEIIAIAKKNKLIVLEDCAQAYAGDVYDGNPLSDVVMFSFGFIKTNTAATGAVIKINDARLFSQVTTLNNLYPMQRTQVYFKKLLKAGFVKLLGSKAIYTGFYKLISLLGKDFDQALSGFTRGFPGDDILGKIRYRPCAANIRLIRKKLKNFLQQSITERVKLANDVLKDLPYSNKVGAENKQHTYWVIPVDVNEPEKLIAYLRNNGFDASQKASSLVRLEGASNDADELKLDNLVYLPAYTGMDKKNRLKLNKLLIDFLG